MSQSDQLSTEAVETRKSTIEQSQRAFQQALSVPLEQSVQFQKSTAKAVMNGLEMGSWAQRQWIDLAGAAFSNYFDIAEDAEEMTARGSQQASRAATSVPDESMQRGRQTSPTARQQLQGATGNQQSQTRPPRQGQSGAGQTGGSPRGGGQSAPGMQSQSSIGQSQAPVGQQPSSPLTQHRSPTARQGQQPTGQQGQQQMGRRGQQQIGQQGGQPTGTQQPGQGPPQSQPQEPPDQSIGQQFVPPGPQGPPSAYRRDPPRSQQVPITQYAEQEGQGDAGEQSPQRPEPESQDREQAQPPGSV